MKGNHVLNVSNPTVSPPNWIIFTGILHFNRMSWRSLGFGWQTVIPAIDSTFGPRISIEADGLIDSGKSVDQDQFCYLGYDLLSEIFIVITVGQQN